MTIYQSKFLALIFSETHALLEIIWLEGTSEMTAEEYKEEFLGFLYFVLQYKPEKMMIDERSMGFPVTPQLQDWVQQTITPKIIEAGKMEVAIIKSNDLIQQLAVEQLMEDEKLEEAMIPKFFDNKPEAMEWLLNN